MHFPFSIDVFAALNSHARFYTNGISIRNYFGVIIYFTVMKESALLPCPNDFFVFPICIAYVVVDRPIQQTMNFLFYLKMKISHVFHQKMRLKSHHLLESDALLLNWANSVVSWAICSFSSSTIASFSSNSSRLPRRFSSAHSQRSCKFSNDV